MTRLTTVLTVCLSLPVIMNLAGCGGADESFDDFGSDSASFAVPNDFDESQLPADFPNNLIPPDYHTGNYIELGSVATGSFETGASVANTVEHYTDLLGAPGLDNTSTDGERTAQWDASPWTLSVVGNASESLVGLSRTGE